MTKLQRYQLRLSRNNDGSWTVSGYWEIPVKDLHGKAHNSHERWSMDGEPLRFSTRKEALEFCLTATGIPE
jgi:hypothetical protein